MFEFTLHVFPIHPSSFMCAGEVRASIYHMFAFLSNRPLSILLSIRFVCLFMLSVKYLGLSLGVSHVIESI